MTKCFSLICFYVTRTQLICLLSHILYSCSYLKIYHFLLSVISHVTQKLSPFRDKIFIEYNMS